MLTRNCVKKLFKPNDTNARVTVFSEKADPITYKLRWLDTICNSLGKGIVNSTDAQPITIIAANGHYIDGFMTGNQLMNTLERSFYEPISLRINLSGWPTRSWIIILEDDLGATEN